jgi:hypothetical protein
MHHNTCHKRAQHIAHASVTDLHILSLDIIKRAVSMSKQHTECIRDDRLTKATCEWNMVRDRAYAIQEGTITRTAIARFSLGLRRSASLAVSVLR